MRIVRGTRLVLLAGLLVAGCAGCATATVRVRPTAASEALPAPAAHLSGSCAAAVGTSCTALAIAHLRGDGVAMFDRRAGERLLRRGCALGDMAACELHRSVDIFCGNVWLRGYRFRKLPLPAPGQDHPAHQPGHPAVQ